MVPGLPMAWAHVQALHTPPRARAAGQLERSICLRLDRAEGRGCRGKKRHPRKRNRAARALP